MTFDIEKQNPSLGYLVHQHLVDIGLETPMVDCDTTPQEKIEKIKPLINQLLTVMGLDVNDDSLADTPKRVAKMFVNEQLRGLNYENFPKCTSVENKFGYGTEFILEKNIRISSLCEHHLLPIKGVAAIAYIPKDKVLGLSKLNRLAEFFSKRPQVQERLTKQIAEAIKFVSGCDDVAVFIEAQHDCVQTRGVEDPCSDTITLAAHGLFADPHNPIRREFLQICNAMMIQK